MSASSTARAITASTRRRIPTGPAAHLTRARPPSRPRCRSRTTAATTSSRNQLAVPGPLPRREWQGSPAPCARSTSRLRSWPCGTGRPAPATPPESDVRLLGTDQRGHLGKDRVGDRYVPFDQAVGVEQVGGVLLLGDEVFGDRAQAPGAGAQRVFPGGLVQAVLGGEQLRGVRRICLDPAVALLQRGGDGGQIA